MLIVGAKGFAKEVLEVLFQTDQQEDLAFYDDVSEDAPALQFGRFPVLRTLQQAHEWFAKSPHFALGVGNPRVRRTLTEKMQNLGGILTSTVSPLATVGRFGNAVGVGCNIMTGSVLTSDILMGEGVLVNLNCTIGHDVVIGDYCELCPGVHLSGHVELGENCVLGTGAVVLPGVKIGANSVIGAGSVVTKNVEAFTLAVGVPAKATKSLVMHVSSSTRKVPALISKQARESQKAA